MSVTTQLELSTSRIIFLLTDVDGVTPLLNLNASLTTLKWTLYEEETQTILNSRSLQDIKGTNGFILYDTPQTDPTTGELYNVLGRLDPSDNAVVTEEEIENHIALFEWTWGNPLRTGRGEVTIPVRNLTYVSGV